MFVLQVYHTINTYLWITKSRRWIHKLVSSLLTSLRAEYATLRAAKWTIQLSSNSDRSSFRGSNCQLPISGMLHSHLCKIGCNTSLLAEEGATVGRDYGAR